MVYFIMKNRDAIAFVTTIAAGILVAKWLGIWDDTATSMMASGLTGTRVAGMLLDMLGFLSPFVLFVGIGLMALCLFQRKQGGRRGM